MHVHTKNALWTGMFTVPFLCSIKQNNTKKKKISNLSIPLNSIISIWCHRRRRIWKKTKHKAEMQLIKIETVQCIYCIYCICDFAKLTSIFHLHCCLLLDHCFSFRVTGKSPNVIYVASFICIFMSRRLFPPVSKNLDSSEYTAFEPSK